MNVFAGEEIGARIAQAREEAGLHQHELADLIDLSVRQVQNLENGSSKPYKHLKQIAEATNRPFAWFLHGDAEDGDSSEIQDSLAQLADALGTVSQKLDDVLTELRRHRQDD